MIDQDIAHAENIEEGRYDVARSAALIVTATADEFRARLKTQVESYANGMRRLREQRAQAEDASHRHLARLVARDQDVNNLDIALTQANATITALAKKARVKAAVVPYPVLTEPDYQREGRNEGATLRNTGLSSPNLDAPPL